MSAGATVSEGVKTAYEALRTDQKHRYVVYNLNDKNVIEAEATGERSVTFEDFLEKLRQSYADQCRWAVYDYVATVQDGTTREKKVFITWCPKQANMRQQMIYKASTDVLRKHLDGICGQVQASSFEDVEGEVKAALHCQ
uniref:Cofilin n=1 Tax=Rhipicephalus zambeziensis TaxID=60191 RepID=A0A224YQE2_9ACAR